MVPKVSRSILRQSLHPSQRSGSLHADLQDLSSANRWRLQPKTRPNPRTFRRSLTNLRDAKPSTISPHRPTYVWSPYRRDCHTSPANPLELSPINPLPTNPPTSEPNHAQLNYINNFFTTPKPTHLWSSPNFRDLPLSSAPEIVVLGRSNVGKSSLLNALLGPNAKALAFTSKHAGRTKEFVAFGVGGVRRGRAAGPHGKHFERWEVERGRGGLVVLDMPGYGVKTRPEWGKEIVKYLKGRRQLRRVFVLVNAFHGCKESDNLMLRLLRTEGIPYQVVLSKIDLMIGSKSGKLTQKGMKSLLQRAEQVNRFVLQQAKEERKIPPVGDTLGVSGGPLKETGLRSGIGIEGLRWNILQAIGLDCDEEGRRREVAFDVVDD